MLRMRHAATVLATFGLIGCSGGDEPTGHTPPPTENRGGAITASVLGLPPDAELAFTVTGPTFTPLTLGIRDTLRGLQPGDYVIKASDFTTATDIFSAVDSTISVRVVADSLSVASVRYAVASGWIKIETPGLPPGATVPVNVGTIGYRVETTAPGIVRPLRPGRYGVNADRTVYAGDRYAPFVNAVVDVKAGEPTIATLAYSIVSGRLIVSTSGLPNGAVPGIRLKSRIPVIPEQEIGLLDAGEVDLTADTIVVAGQTYVPLTMFPRFQIAASTQPTRFTIPYTIPSARLDIQVSGLPDSIPASVRIFGPNLYSKELGASTTLTALTPGHYIVHADDVQDAFGPLASPLEFDLTNAATASASFAYAPLFLAITVNVRGLPAGTDAAIEFGGPSIPEGTVITKSTTITITPPSPGPKYGHYAFTPLPVQTSREGFVPTSQPFQVFVFPKVRPHEVTVDYVGHGPMNLSVEGVRVMQQSYRLDGTVPLVAGREAMLTAFIRGDTLNGAKPPIRARLYSGSMLVHTLTFPASSYSVPTTVAFGNVLGWFTARIPATWVQPGLGVVVDVDPANFYIESNEGDNVFPASQTPIPVRVAAVRATAVTMVPITQSATGVTGVVNASNINEFLNDTRRMLPLGTITTKLRTPFTITGQALSPTDPATWVEALNQLAALRSAEGTGGHYFGIVQTAHLSGIAGFGTIGGWEAIGWDRRPSGSAIMAHELGHNFGLLHSPCGTSEGVDPTYPHPGGRIGFGGVDLVSGFPYGAGTPDFMGYCPDPWISDYSYEAIFNNVSLGPATRQALPARSEPGLLVWGRLQNGRPILEPVFDVDAPPTLPMRSGANILEAFAEDGTKLLGFSFDGERLDHAQSGDRVFAFVVPKASLNGRTVGAWRLTSNGSSTELRAPDQRIASAPHAGRAPNGRMQLSTRDTSVRGLMVRDARTGEILSFGRGTSLSLVTRATMFNVTVSDGVRSSTHRVSAAPR